MRAASTGENKKRKYQPLQPIGIFGAAFLYAFGCVGVLLNHSNSPWAPPLVVSRLLPSCPHSTRPLVNKTAPRCAVLPTPNRSCPFTKHTTSLTHFGQTRRNRPTHKNNLENTRSFFLNPFRISKYRHRLCLRLLQTRDKIVSSDCIIRIRRSNRLWFNPCHSSPQKRTIFLFPPNESTPC